MCDHQQTIILLRSLKIYAAPASLVHTLDKDKEKREGGRRKTPGKKFGPPKIDENFDCTKYAIYI